MQIGIRHISCDFWGTLAKSNPLFTETRIAFIRENFLPSRSDSAISTAIEKVGRWADEVNMKTGVSISSMELYQKVFAFLDIELDAVQLQNLLIEIERIFIQFPPFLLNDYLLEDFKQLHDTGYSFSIGSNTAYIPGGILLKSMKKMGLTEFFSFYVFSDEINCSKPYPKFFEAVASGARPFKKDEILHIGDNYEADLVGATGIGIKALLVDFNKNRLIDL